jgi:predicted site-specific integrase-resolvase
MKLSTWAKKEGVCYRTAWNWFKNGTLPVNAEQTPTGTILIKEDNRILNAERVVIYCRVSNHSRREELSFQVKRCEDFCSANGWSLDKVYKEVASGLNDNRKEFWKALDSNPSKIIVENKDRLTRFGFNYLDKLLKERGTQIIVIHRDKEDEADLLKDMVSILYSFCARLYGLRRAYAKAKKCELLIKQE